MPLSPPQVRTHPELQQAFANPVETLLRNVGFAPLESSGWIRVTGADRVSWLNGMVTNRILDLAEGAGCYNFFLNAQGRIQGDAYAFATPESILLETGQSQVETLLSMLDRFIIMDDVELTDVTSTMDGISIIGPQARQCLETVGLAPRRSSDLTLAQLAWRGSEVSLIKAHSPLVPRFEVWGEPRTITSLRDELLSSGAVPSDRIALETLRLLEGTPLFGTDIRDRDLPQETAQTRALHFAKGCYLGQEIVERIRSRGNVHRVLHGFLVEGTPSCVPTPLTAGDKQVGELTSFASVPKSLGLPDCVALGTVRREILEQGVPLSVEDLAVTPVVLPLSAAIAKLSTSNRQE